MLTALCWHSFEKGNTGADCINTLLEVVQTAMDRQRRAPSKAPASEDTYVPLHRSSRLVFVLQTNAHVAKLIERYTRTTGGIIIRSMRGTNCKRSSNRLGSIVLKLGQLHRWD